MPLYKTSQLAPRHPLPPIAAATRYPGFRGQAQEGSSLPEPAPPQHEGAEKQKFPELPGSQKSGRCLPGAQKFLPCHPAMLFSSPGSLGLKNVLSILGGPVRKSGLSIITLTSKNNIHLQLDNIGMNKKKSKCEFREQIMAWGRQITELLSELRLPGWAVSLDLGIYMALKPLQLSSLSVLKRASYGLNG